MLQLAQDDSGYTKRDLAPNINFFMNVPVSSDGGLKFAGWCIGSRLLCRNESDPSHDGADQQLPATEQSLQRL